MPSMFPSLNFRFKVAISTNSKMAAIKGSKTENLFEAYYEIVSILFLFCQCPMEILLEYFTIRKIIKVLTDKFVGPDRQTFRHTDNMITTGSNFCMSILTVINRATYMFILRKT